MSLDQILMTRKDVEQMTGLGRSSIYKMMSEGAFPRPLKVSAYAVRWRRDEIVQWIESRPRATGEVNKAA